MFSLADERISKMPCSVERRVGSTHSGAHRISQAKPSSHRKLIIYLHQQIKQCEPSIPQLGKCHMR